MKSQTGYNKCFQTNSVLVYKLDLKTKRYMIALSLKLCDLCFKDNTTGHSSWGTHYWLRHTGLQFIEVMDKFSR